MVVGCHVMRRLPDPSIERNSRRFMLGLPHTGDRMGSSLRLGSDQSSWLTRAEVAVGSKSAPNRASAASLVPLWRHSQKAGGGMNLNDVRFPRIADMKHRIVSIISAGFDPKPS